MTVTPEQAREARKLLGWSMDRTAGEVGISRTGVQKLKWAAA